MERYSDIMLASEERALVYASKEKGRENPGEVGEGGHCGEGEERRDKQGNVSPCSIHKGL